MSLFNRRGYKTIKARDTKTGKVFNAPVRTGSAIARIAEQKQRKAMKQRQQDFREFKAKLREAKRVVPLADRAKVNWSELR